MKKVLTVVFFIAIPAILLASGGDDAVAQQYFKVTGRHTDLGPRIFNFVILAALLWYLLANPIKEFLKNRRESIANELKEIEQKRQAAIDQKAKAEDEAKEAEVKAVEIVEDAKREAALLEENIKKQTEQELMTLEKVYNEKMEIERRKTIKETTKRVLNEGISSEDIPLDAEKIINIVTKEVA